MTYYYLQQLNVAIGEQDLQTVTGFPTTTSPDVLASNGIYEVIETPNPYDLNLYYATPVYTVVGNYANQSWTGTPVTLDQAKEGAAFQLKQQADETLSQINYDLGYNPEILSGVAAQPAVSRPVRFQVALDALDSCANNLDQNLTAIESATSVDEINNIVNKPTGILFTGRGSGLGPEDLNVSYYNAFNSVSMTESETEIYIPGTATVIPYGSGGPNAFDSMGNAFNPGDYLMQIRETATSMVIAEFECPLNPTGEDVAF